MVAAHRRARLSTVHNSMEPEMEDMDTGGGSVSDESFKLTADVDEGPDKSPSFNRKRVSISDDQGQSAKLALVEARVELDDLRRLLVEANADRAASRLEQKCERDVAARAAQRYEETSFELRKEVDMVRELLEADLLQAEDALNIYTEKARGRQRELEAELASVRGAVDSAAASTLQRVFNKRWTRGLQERCYTATARAEQAEAEHARLKDELDESQRALQSSAARTLQRALQGKMHIAISAAGGDVAALNTLREERRLADVRQLENEQAHLRTELNESRRRAARLDKRLAQADGGAMLVANAVRQILVSEISSAEIDRNEVIATLEERLSVVRKRMINLSLKLSAAQSKAKVATKRQSDAEAGLLQLQQRLASLEVRAADADSRAALMQEHALEKEQEAALSADSISRLERKSAMDGHRLSNLASDVEQRKAAMEKSLRGELEQLSAQLEAQQAESGAQISELTEQLAAARADLENGVAIKDAHINSQINEMALAQVTKERDASLGLLMMMLARLGVSWMPLSDSLKTAKEADGNDSPARQPDSPGLDDSSTPHGARSKPPSPLKHSVLALAGGDVSFRNEVDSPGALPGHFEERKRRSSLRGGSAGRRGSGAGLPEGDPSSVSSAHSAHSESPSPSQSTHDSMRRRGSWARLKSAVGAVGLDALAGAGDALAGAGDALAAAAVGSTADEGTKKRRNRRGSTGSAEPVSTENEMRPRRNSSDLSADPAAAGGGSRRNRRNSTGTEAGGGAGGRRGSWTRLQELSQSSSMTTHAAASMNKKRKDVRPSKEDLGAELPVIGPAYGLQGVVADLAFILAHTLTTQALTALTEEAIHTQSKELLEAHRAEEEAKKAAKVATAKAAKATDAAAKANEEVANVTAKAAAAADKAADASPAAPAVPVPPAAPVPLGPPVPLVAEEGTAAGAGPSEAAPVTDGAAAALGALSQQGGAQRKADENAAATATQAAAAKLTAEHAEVLTLLQAQYTQVSSLEGQVASLQDSVARLQTQMGLKESELVEAARQIAERDAALDDADEALQDAEAVSEAKSRQLQSVAYHLSRFLGGVPLTDMPEQDPRLQESAELARMYREANGQQHTRPATAPAPPGSELVRLLRDEPSSNGLVHGMVPPLEMPPDLSGGDVLSVALTAHAHVLTPIEGGVRSPSRGDSASACAPNRSSGLAGKGMSVSQSTPTMGIKPAAKVGAKPAKLPPIDTQLNSLAIDTTTPKGSAGRRR